MKYNASWGYNGILWDGTDEGQNRLANGTYIYRVTVIKDGEKKEQTNKLVIIR